MEDTGTTASNKIEIRDTSISAGKLSEVVKSGGLGSQPRPVTSAKGPKPTLQHISLFQPQVAPQ